MNFYVKKIIDFVTTLFLVTLLTFVTFNIIPGNPALAILGPDADEVQIEQLSKDFNLDKPLYKRYFIWIFNAVKGDFGISYKFNQDVSSLVVNSILTTLNLSLYTILFTIIIGIPLGIIFAHFNKNPFTKIIEIINQVFISTPSFCTALILILFFTIYLNIFPSMGFTKISKNFFENFKTLFLPSLSLALGSSAILAKYLKSSFIEQENKNYVKTAYSKGLSTFYVNIHHIFRNSLISIVTILGLILTEILGGSIIIENIFSIPGVGKLIMTAIILRDFPLIQGLSLYLAIISVTINFIVEILYSFIDPRIKLKNQTKENILK